MTVQELIDALSTISDKKMRVCFIEENQMAVLYVHGFEVQKLSNDELVVLLNGD